MTKKIYLLGSINDGFVVNEKNITLPKHISKRVVVSNEYNNAGDSSTILVIEVQGALKIEHLMMANKNKRSPCNFMYLFCASLEEMEDTIRRQFCERDYFALADKITAYRRNKNITEILGIF